MALTDDTLRLNIDINGKKAQNELGKLEQETKGLKDTNKNLRLELQKLEAAGKKNTDEYKRLQTQIKNNNATVKTNEARMGGLRKEIGLNGLTAKQLRQEYRRLKQAMDNTTPGTAAWKKYNNEMKAVKSRMDQVNTGSRRAGRSFGILRELLPVAGIGALANVIQRAVGQMFNLAKVMEADAIRSAQVFGDHLGYVEKQADKLAAKMGLTTREFVSAATATGDLLIPLDFTREQAAEMSTELQGLAGALDEWTGGQYGAAGVAQILTKAMLGENEQLKQLGIAIRQDSKEFKDLVDQKKEAKDVTEGQARALATLDLIQKKSADAQAAYNKQGNQLLRTQKQISAWWKNMKESVVRWFQESPVEELQREQEEVNKLVIQLRSANVEESTREKILNRLQQIAPQVAQTITDEEGNLDDLNNTLDKYNQNMTMKILLKEQEQQISQREKWNTEAQKEFRESEADMIEAMNESLEWFKDKGPEYSRQAEKILYNDKLSVFEKARQLRSMSMDASMLGNTGLTKALNEYAKQRKNVEEGNSIMERLTNRAKEMKEEYAMVMGEEFENESEERDDTSQGGKETEAEKPSPLDAMDTESIKEELDQSLSEMESMTDDYLNNFSNKWKEYQEIQGEYIPIDKNTHDLAIEKLDELYNDQIISYEQYQEAKKAIDEQIAIEEEQKRIERREKENELKELKTENEAADFETKLEIEQSRFDREMELLQQKYHLEQQMAGDNKDKLLQAEINYQKNTQKLEKEHSQEKEKLVNQEMEMEQGRLKVAQAVLGGLATVAGEESKLAQAALIAKKGVALAEATMALGIGKANTAKVGFPQNVPLIAAFVAQTAGFISSIKNAFSSKDQSSLDTSGIGKSGSGSTSGIGGKKSGGFTGWGSDDEVADFTHRNEFVVNAKGVRNPNVRKVIDVIDVAQRNGSIATLNFSDIFGAARGGGKQSGGHSGSSGGSSPPQVVETIPADFTNTMRELQSEISRLRRQGVKVSKYGRNSLSEAMEDIEHFNRSVR